MSFYSQTILQDGPISYWRLGELTGTTAVDVQGVASGTYTGTGIVIGKAGAIASDNDAAASFPATSFTAALLANVAALNLGGSACTLECWVKTSVSSFSHLIGGYNANSPFNGYALAIGPVTAGKLAYWSGGGNSNSWFESPGVSVADGSWHYVAVTVSATQTILYIDGAASGSIAADLRPTSYAGGRALASRADGASGLNGLLDESAIYNVALSPARIAAHYQAGVKAGLIAGPVGNCPFICGRAA
jgi:hypothetical protein